MLVHEGILERCRETVMSVPTRLAVSTGGQKMVVKHETTKERDRELRKWNK